MREWWESTSVVVDGVELGVHRTGGSKPPLVLVHGITDSGLCWARVAHALEADWDVVMIDARGHGRSAHPGSYSFAEHVQDLTGVLEALDLQGAVLVGHSMGGPHVTEDRAAYDLEAWQAGIAADNARSLEELLVIGRSDNPAWVEEDLQP